MNATEALTRMSIRFDGWEVRDTRPPYSDDEFFNLCFQNPDLRIEQDVDGNTIVMAPVSFDSGNFESEFLGDLVIWNRKYKLGKTFSSATLFILPNGEKRMPDAAWIAHEKVDAMPAAERKQFAHIVPDFVAELRSPSDDLGELHTKMRDSWIGNGVQLAWLIDPLGQKAWVYRADATVETIEDFNQCLSGEQVLPGFELSLLRFIG